MSQSVVLMKDVNFIRDEVYIKPSWLFRISSPRDEIHCSAMWCYSMTTRHPTAHYHRSQQQELAPALVLVGVTAKTPAPFMDPADRRWYTLQHSCRMVQGLSSWPHWVDATHLCCLRDLMMMMMIVVWCHRYSLSGAL